MNEYELLRAEIIEYYVEINNCTNVLYATVAAVLVFAIQSGNWLICLIPYFVIVPLYLACAYKHRIVCELAAYMSVFLEGKEYNWERRHHKFDVKYSKGNETWPWGIVYYITSCACSALSLYEILNSSFNCSEMWTRSCIVILILVIMIAIMKNNDVQYVKKRGEIIEQWTAYKKGEDEVTSKITSSEKGNYKEQEASPCGK